MRIIDYFDKGVTLAPDRAFLIDEAGTRTYRQAQAMSHRLANAFKRTGIRPGTKAAVYSHNAARAFECVLGLLRAGCVWVPVNVRNTVDDTVYTLDNLDAEVLFYSAAFAKAAAELRARCPRIAHAICIEELDGDAPSLDQWTAGLPEMSEEIQQSDDEIVTLFSSGGTTGAPKGVIMANSCWEMMIAGSQRLYRLDHPVHLVAAPLTHAAGGSALVMAPMGTTNVLLPGFDPVGVMEAIERYRVTHLFLPPTAIYGLLAHPDVRKYDYSSLRFFTYASAPMPPEKIKEAMDVFGPVMTNSFGQTETGLNTTYFAPEEHVEALEKGLEHRLRSVGRASLFNRIAIMDDNGNLLPPDTPGEIVARGTQLMKGYYKNPEETEKARAFGWHHTGDIGYLDSDGYLYLIDRKRDMIISGGFNVFPAEVEKTVVTHPAVKDCAVVGVPDEKWGEAVTAVLELKSEQTVTAEEIIAFCRARLSAVKTPKRIEFWSELPRSPVGKVLRRKVREHFWQGRSRAI